LAQPRGFWGDHKPLLPKEGGKKKTAKTGGKTGTKNRKKNPKPPKGTNTPQQMLTTPKKETLTNRLWTMGGKCGGGKKKKEPTKKRGEETHQRQRSLGGKTDLGWELIGGGGQKVNFEKAQPGKRWQKWVGWWV